ncbi:TetR/AcrR family transcriptional regulator [Deinococcus cellulosilyticus]|uniref:TetR family transcriptional regulator n=1 Tax=Deinococcus cellulosilyticus (strain DSM 18568 / NBRC 106333 / KACC 11606 / 5516J-15) TaxID=1223518 RepID=A0A511N301_DEIC1|nr:TetR/AcrR family transcriptional regulator [Deinococcus cellulosilyticus]GEM47234.1 TetR family transcriptional regulator [Deinococcus cellulosilyticus NBRC 106333 = KACC 11606]
MPPRKSTTSPSEIRSETETRPRLSRERVLQKAIEIADQEGIQALTMRKLAQEMGVEAMSLYHHFANKDRLLDGMIDLVFAEIELPTEGPWKSRIQTRSLSARTALTRHRWALGLMESRTSPGPETLRHHNAVIECLRSSGFSVAATAHAYSLLDSYIYGFALQQINLPFTRFEEGDAAAESIMMEVAAGAYPHLTELAVEHVLKPGYDYTREFEIGLEIVLEGLEKLRDRG